MTTPKLTADQKAALLHLVSLRAEARSLVRNKETNRTLIRMLEAALAQGIRTGDTKAEALHKIDLAEAKEAQIELEFDIIELGHMFMLASRHYDKLPREVWLRALSVNESEWSSPTMLEYGDSVRNVVAVLRMENSATGKEDDYELAHKPLHWCCTMAMMNATQTNPKMGKAVHDLTNTVFDGAFGEWKAPSMLEQIGVRR